MFVTIHPYEVGLHYVNGRFEGKLGPGRHLCFGLLGRTRIVTVDSRLRILSLPGQEIVTKDKVNVRLSVALQYRIVDPVKAVHELTNHDEKLYQDVQLALRALVADKELDALLEVKDELDRALLERVAPEAQKYGMEVAKAGVKDVILPGELRAIMNRVIEAKRSAQAALIAAREEAAIARTRQNVAAMLKENPALLELLKLEALKEMAKTGGNTFAFGMPAFPA